MFCQWCGKRREENSIAIHHCGPKSRPPVVCIGCGTALDGASACPSCGTPAGTVPVAETPAAPPPSADDEEATAMTTGGPNIGAGPREPLATRAPGAVEVPAPRPSVSIQGANLGAAALATLCCFIPWTVGGLPGANLAEHARPWHWWGPPSPRLVVGGIVLALVLAAVAAVTRNARLDVVVGALGVALTALVVDVVWEVSKVVGFVTSRGRRSAHLAVHHDYSVISGLWVVLAAVVLLAVGAVRAIRASRA